MKLNQLKQIDIAALEWFDAVNANSYFAAEIIFNRMLPKKRIILSIPFQYGYDQKYLESAHQKIEEYFGVKFRNLDDFAHDNNIILHYYILRNSKKSVVKSLGGAA